jgi:branched-chain amino acid transport system permease protein
MEFFIISMLNGLSYGLLLFMLSSGLTLIFSMMGVLNFAHASFYMVGAYVGYSIAKSWASGRAGARAAGGGRMGALFERWCLRKVHKFGHVPELLVTFGLSYVIVELVQLVWGRIAVEFRHPSAAGPAFTLINHSVNGLRCSGAPRPRRCARCRRRHSRGVLAVPGHPRLHDAGRAGDAGVGLAAAHAHAHRAGDPGRADAPRGMVESLGHNVPRVFMLVFGAGTALAGWPA